MKIAVMGTGMVGRTLANKLLSLGHEVILGARESSNKSAAEWSTQQNAKADNYRNAAEGSEMIIFAVNGAALLEAAKMTGYAAMSGKLVIDVTNPLKFSNAGLPTLVPELSNTTSAGEELQAAFPGAKIVKALNTMSCQVMVDPKRVAGKHDVFLCGNDDSAKLEVVKLLQSFGWDNPIDMGNIEAARGLEGLMPFWLRMWQVVGTTDFNYAICRGQP